MSTTWENPGRGLGNKVLYDERLKNRRSNWSDTGIKN